MSYVEKNHNVVTGEITEILYTDEQIKEAKANEKQAKEFAEKVTAQAEAKAQAKAAAEGKLAALGLTTDDLRALGL